MPLSNPQNSGISLPSSISLNRRTFLQSTTLGIAGLAMAGSSFGADSPAKLPSPIQLPDLEDSSEPKSGPPPTALAPEDRVGFAIVGLGHLALGQILPAFAQSRYCKTVALVSGDADKARQLARQYGIADKSIYNYETYDHLAENPEVSVIYIVLPNSMHAEFTVRGAKAGKHILCEKPMSTSSADCQKMIDACKAASKKLMIAYRIQYEPHHLLVKSLLAQQKIGIPRVLTSENIQRQSSGGQWRLKKALAGGGCLPDIGLYCLNTARFILGEEPSSVIATKYSSPDDPRFKEIEEEISFMMQFPSGTRAICAASYNGHGSDRYRIVGTTGWLEMDPAFHYKGLRMRQSNLDPADDHAEVVQEHLLDEKDQFALEMDHMADCILNQKEPKTPGEEGLRDQKIMEAIYRSAESQAMVAL